MMTEILGSSWFWLPLATLGVVVVIAMVVLIGGLLAYLGAYLTGRVDLDEGTAAGFSPRHQPPTPLRHEPPWGERRAA